MSEADVERIVFRDFGNNRRADILSVLGELAVCLRVRLAILKLADCDFDNLQEAVKIAQQDHRDVIAAAEYPRYTREIGFSDVSETLVKDIIESDWKQYREWLERV